MQRKITEIIPKISQYEDIEYSPAYLCPLCNRSGFYYFDWPNPPDPPYLIGWCDTNIGFQIICQCSRDFTKFRFHGTSQRQYATIEEFEEKLLSFAKRSANWKEIKEKLEDES